MTKKKKEGYIYRITYENEELGYYITLTKCKIKTRLEEHSKNIKFNRRNTALAQSNKKENRDTL